MKTFFLRLDVLVIEPQAGSVTVRISVPVEAETRSAAALLFESAIVNLIVEEQRRKEQVVSAFESAIAGLISSCARCGEPNPSEEHVRSCRGPSK